MMCCWSCSRELREGDEVVRHATRRLTLGAEDERKAHDRQPDEYACLDCFYGRSKGQRLRIVAIGDDFSQVSARIVQPDGTEIPIDDMIRSLTWTVTDGDYNTATVTFERVHADLSVTMDGEPFRPVFETGRTYPAPGELPSAATLAYNGTGGPESVDRPTDR